MSPDASTGACESWTPRPSDEDEYLKAMETDCDVVERLRHGDV